MRLAKKHPQETMEEYLERTFVPFRDHLNEPDPDQARIDIMNAMKKGFTR